METTKTGTSMDAGRERWDKGVGRAKVVLMPESAEMKVRMAVDHWEVPSEMMEEAAWMVPFLVSELGNALGQERVDGRLLSAVRRLWPREAARVAGLRTYEERRRWFEVVTAGDRLTAWKVGLEARLQRERLLAAVFDDRVLTRRYRVLSRVMEEWRVFDEIPAMVAAEMALALLWATRMEPRLAAVRRLAPAWAERARREPEEYGRGFPGVWMASLARKDPVLVLKVAIEATLRSGAGLGRDTRELN